MNCTICDLPFTEIAPCRDVLGRSHGDESLCLHLLRIALIEAQKPSVAAVYGYEAGLNDGLNEASTRISALEAEVAKLREQTTPISFAKQTPADAHLLRVLAWRPMHYSDGRGAWLISDKCTTVVQQACRYTHWLPMPPAPEVEA